MLSEDDEEEELVEDFSISGSITSAKHSVERVC